MTFIDSGGNIEDRRKAVVLLSGGIDSSTTLAIAKAEGYDLYVMSFDYNQRHLTELVSARMVATALTVKKHLTVKFDLREIGGSALTSDIEVPKDRDMRPGGSQQSIPVTYVPARNTIFLSYALAWAEVLNTGDIFIGANAVDYSGYPDCRPEYLKSFESMANLATKAAVEGSIRFAVHAPLIHMKKSEIIKLGAGLGLDYSLTWSCYDPQPLEFHGDNQSPMTSAFRHNHSPCGKCESCNIRQRGFLEAGMLDPLNILVS